MLEAVTGILLLVLLIIQIVVLLQLMYNNYQNHQRDKKFWAEQEEFWAKEKQKLEALQIVIAEEEKQLEVDDKK